MVAYYNENDAKAAAWLRELIKQGHIANGDVDERSIVDVTPSDLQGYTQCHFFAGIGVWSYALRNAGWSDDRHVWTGSCPCQPFSTAGRGKGVTDERHLWPHWYWLISQCRPSEVFGEQVASKDGRAWLDTVQTDMEVLGFAVGAADLCAAGVGAPQIRQRLWFYGNMVNTNDTRPQGHRRLEWINGTQGREATERHSSPSSVHDWMEHTSSGCADSGEHGLLTQDGSVMRSGYQGSRVGTQQLAHSERKRLSELEQQSGNMRETNDTGSSDNTRDGSGPVVHHTTSPTNGFWRDADWLGCKDDKFRPVRPGSFPLVDGASARVGRLRGYGNAIVAPLAQTFIEATQGW